MRQTAFVITDKAGPARLLRRALAAAALSAAMSGVAQAQTIMNNGGSFNAGYGGTGGTFNGPIDVATRDENGNTVFVNGVMQTPAGSIFSRTSGVSQSSSTGVGGTGLATAIGNNLQVIVQGSFNVVNVESTQVNNGNITATTSLNGQVNLDGP